MLGWRALFIEDGWSSACGFADFLIPDQAYMRSRLSRAISVVLSEILSYIENSLRFLSLWLVPIQGEPFA
jgi:hypothetical protein